MTLVHAEAVKNIRIVAAEIKQMGGIHNAHTGYQNCIEGILKEIKHSEKGNLTKLLSLLENPQDKMKYIHIAGTNGKGSVAVTLSNILSAAGYKTGLFVSPGIEAVNDRFRIDGERIPDGELVELAQKVQTVAEEVGGSFCEFELMMCVGLLYYVQHGCDIVVLETGIGGRADCTNIIPHKEAAVITSIGFDHMALLGNTLREIAAQKAGIISTNGFAVCGVMPQEAMEEIKRQADALNAKAVFVNEEEVQFAGISGEMQLLSYKEFTNVRLSLQGYQQLINGAVVLEVCKHLREIGWKISENAITQGFSKTKWEGRMERVCNSPLVILDGAHNPESARMLKYNLDTYFADKSVIYVIGMMRDKDKSEVLQTLLPGCKAAIAVTMPAPRGERGEILQDMMKEYCQNCSYNVTMKEALSEAEAICGENDMICVCGSLYLIQEVRAHYKVGGYLD